MGPNIGNGKVHKSGKANRTAHKVREHKESAAIHAGETISRDTVHRAGHRKFANTKVEVAAVWISFIGTRVRPFREEGGQSIEEGVI